MSVRFQGQCLSYEMRASSLEVRMHQAPCNEIGLQTLAELEKLCADVKQHLPELRSVLFYSSLASGFCAGADLRSLYSGLLDRQEQGRSQEQNMREIRQFLDRIHQVFNFIDTIPILSVAAVHGPVFGGGFELALTNDVIVADATARFCFPELRLGLVPGFGGIPRLRRDVGNAIVRDLLLSGRSIGARRAHEVGLVAQRVGKNESLQTARALCEQAARFDRVATSAAKKFVKSLPHDELEREKEVFCELAASETLRVALQRFVQSNELRPYLP